jgi:cytochrome c-type biogenesis protein CcmE
MAWTRKKRRTVALAVGGALIAGASALAVTAFRDSMVFFMPPTDLLAQAPAPDRRLRVGGMVVEGSVARDASETVRFTVSDYESQVEVAYSGVLPDLFAEGQGAVAEGYFRDGRFHAVEVLAKHDETYMPREIADTLRPREAGG